MRKFGSRTVARVLLVGGLLVALVLPGSQVASSEISANDPYRAKQWGLDLIRAEDAWPHSTGRGVVVAVIDTGVDLTHPDLAANIQTSKGGDFVDPCNPECSGNGPQDEFGHGTGVAGIIAAVTNNGVGIAGVAPDAKILPVRVIDPNVGGGDTPRRIAAGILYAADRNAKVINISLGEALWPADRAQGNVSRIYPAIDYALSKGVLIAISAGNLSEPICNEPAQHPGVVCVGSVDRRDVRSWFSNFDASHPAYLVAPGGSAAGSGTTFGVLEDLCDEDVYSTFPHTMLGYCASEKGYESSGGTSLAAPHVAGVAALLSARGLTHVQIVDCLRTSSDDLGAPGRDPIYGFGRVNAFRAVTKCL